MVDPDSGLHWVAPQQERSRKTLDRLLDAAEVLVSEKGFADTSVAEVARRAGSSVGAFYTRFPDKNALLYALYDRYLTQAMATADHSLDPERWRGVAIPEILRAVLRFLVRIYREQRGLIRAFVVANQTDLEFQARRERLSHYVSVRLTRLLLDRASEIGHPDPERACHFGLTITFATLDSAILFGETRPAELTLADDDLARELARAYLAYLEIPNDPPEDD